MHTLTVIKRNRFRLVTAGFTLTAAVLLQGCGGNNNSASTTAPPIDSAAVANWNTVALTAVAQFGAANPPGLAPIEDSRIYAMAFSAMHDALNAIDRRYKPYLSDLSAPNADPDAAVAQAVHDVMADQVPAEKTYLDDQLTSSLAAIKDGDAKTKGIALGEQTASAILTARSTDGSLNAQGPYSAPADPGIYQPTPPINAAAFVHWGEVKPFVLQSATQFRAPPDYTVNDAQYVADFNEVKASGGAVSSTRTADQSEFAKFWLENSPDGWDRIASIVATGKGLNGWDRAHLLATLELAEADAFIDGLNDKYFYTFWRPITAIALEDDGNPDTVPDPTWTPFDPVTPPIPDYPSTHSVAGGAAQAVLAAFFGDTVSFSTTSASLPGVTRGYTSFSQAAQENADSRVFVGYHFRNATTVGLAQGKLIGAYVAANTLAKVK